MLLKKAHICNKNRFSSLTTDNQMDSTVLPREIPFNISISEKKETKKINLLLPIFVRGVLDFVDFCDKFIKLVDTDN